MEKSVANNYNKIIEQFEQQRAETVQKSILLKKVIKQLISQEIKIFELDNLAKNQNLFGNAMLVKLNEINGKSSEKMYGREEPDFRILREVNLIGTEQFDILKETQAELRYVERELEAAKMLTGQTLESYDEMKINREYYQLLHSKAVKELNKEK